MQATETEEYAAQMEIPFSITTVCFSSVIFIFSVTQDFFSEIL